MRLQREMVGQNLTTSETGRFAAFSIRGRQFTQSVGNRSSVFDLNKYSRPAPALPR